MKVTISTDYDEVVGNYTDPITIEVPAPPVDDVVHAYECEYEPDGVALNEWAREHFGPHATAESVIVEACDDLPLLRGCEFEVRR